MAGYFPQQYVQVHESRCLSYYTNLDLTKHNKRYFRDNLPRLTDIKGKYDPQDLFSYSQNIPLFKLYHLSQRVSFLKYCLALHYVHIMTRMPISCHDVYVICTFVYCSITSIKYSSYYIDCTFLWTQNCMALFICFPTFNNAIGITLLVSNCESFSNNISYYIYSSMHML